MNSQPAFRFSLPILFWTVALFAAALATLGALGTFVAAIAVWFWFGIWNSQNPRETFRFLSIVLLVFGVPTLLIVAIDRVGATRRYPRRTQCANNVKQIMLGLLNYEQDHGHFPPPYLADENGHPVHSWRVLILPYLAEQPLFDQYRFDEPWDGPHNVKLLAQMPSYYCCSNHRNPVDGECHFAAILGTDSAWQANAQMNDKIGDKNFPAGSAATAMVCETLTGFPWTKPEDITPAQFVQAARSHKPQQILGGHVHETFFTITDRHIALGFADGHVASLPVPQHAYDLELAASRIQKLPASMLATHVQPRVKWARVAATTLFTILIILPGYGLIERASKRSD